MNCKYILLFVSILFLITMVGAVADDTYTTSLLHYDTVGGSTIFTDANPLNAWYGYGGVTINGEGDPIWGNDILFDGTDDFINTQDVTTSFNLGSSNWTWDTRILYTENTTDYSQGIWAMGHYVAGHASADLNIHKSSYGNPFLYITFYRSGITYGQWRYQMTPDIYSKNQWYHLEIARCGNETITTDGIPAEYVHMNLFIDGVKKDWLIVATPPGDTSFGNMENMTLGRNDAAHVPNRYFMGKMDETRFSPGICRNTESFTPPTEPYVSLPTETYYEMSVSKAPTIGVISLLLLLVGIILFAYIQKKRTLK